MTKAQAITHLQTLAIGSTRLLPLVHAAERCHIDGLAVKPDFSCNSTHGCTALQTGKPITAAVSEKRLGPDGAGP
ncbi:hypothetical protein [Hydrogenophaga sp.]|uniref:hypothetical protein n=1 Tax=Hydrogenophaga sp. TaxID=1904254 RepID=UPI00271EDAB8|nr:hypothetical protein [Hydrogenophaga sp.]MDO9131396.1 hypothetical protein [Hydrogenophaga sp.]